MSIFSDLNTCPKCGNITCTCGHEYESWTPQALREHIAMLRRVLQKVIVESKKPGKLIVVNGEHQLSAGTRVVVIGDNSLKDAHGVIRGFWFKDAAWPHGQACVDLDGYGSHTIPVECLAEEHQSPHQRAA